MQTQTFQVEGETQSPQRSHSTDSPTAPPLSRLSYDVCALSGGDTLLQQALILRVRMPAYPSRGDLSPTWRADHHKTINRKSTHHGLNVQRSHRCAPRAKKTPSSLLPGGGNTRRSFGINPTSVAPTYSQGQDKYTIQGQYIYEGLRRYYLPWRVRCQRTFGRRTGLSKSEGLDSNPEHEPTCGAPST
jgi:hypothetical protein